MPKIDTSECKSLLGSWSPILKKKWRFVWIPYSKYKNKTHASTIIDQFYFKFDFSTESFADLDNSFMA